MKELIEKLRTETWSGFAPMAEQAADALERLELEAVAWGVTVDNLREELDALKQQKPIGWVFPDEDYSGSVIKPYADAPSLLPVFIAAGAQPVPEGMVPVPIAQLRTWQVSEETIAMLKADAVNKIRSLK